MVRRHHPIAPRTAVDTSKPWRSPRVGAPDIEPIGLHLTRTAETVNRGFDDALAEAGWSLPLWLILVSLKRKAHDGQRQLAEAVGIEGPTLTHHLNKMETASLVTLRRDPANRRVHHVALTPLGEKTFVALVDAVIAFDQRLREGLTDRQLIQLRRLLNRLGADVAKDGRVHPMRRPESWRRTSTPDVFPPNPQGVGS
jgi:MarR family transcriptional regulator for hemolysin